MHGTALRRAATVAAAAIGDLQGDRCWMFAVAFVYERLGGITLVGLSLFAGSIAAMFVGSYVGDFLDRNTRKNGADDCLAFMPQRSDRNLAATSALAVVF